MNATGNLRKMNLISWKRAARDLRPGRADNFARRTCIRESDIWQSLNETKGDEKEAAQHANKQSLINRDRKIMILFRAVKLLFECHKIEKCKKILFCF